MLIDTVYVCVVATRRDKTTQSIVHSKELMLVVPRERERVCVCVRLAVPSPSRLHSLGTYFLLCTVCICVRKKKRGGERLADNSCICIPVQPYL